MKGFFLFLTLISTQVMSSSEVITCEEPKNESASKLISKISEELCPESLQKAASTNFDKFKILLSKGMNAPIEDFLILWGEESEYEADPYFFKCQKKPWGALTKTTVSHGKHILAKDCRPDVLYSWAEDVKVKNVSKHLPDNGTWSGPANPFKDPAYGSEFKQSLLFLAMTPAMTFGYGKVLMRFKIKKDVPFVDSKKDPGKNEIGFSQLDGMPDFLFSDSSVVESWSYGTEEIYDEIVRDLSRLKSNKRAQIYGMESKKDGLEKLYIGNVDDKVFNEEILKRNLLQLIEMIIKKEGKTFYQKGSCRSLDIHYKTLKPTWFNPK
jgi:hypothetical protein